MQVNQAISVGWEEDVCIKCTADLSGLTAQFVQKIKQNRDCDTALTLTSNLPTNPLVFTYNSNSGDYDYTDGYTNQFDNADNVACPITTCVLKDKTCSTIPTATPTTFFI